MKKIPCVFERHQRLFGSNELCDSNTPNSYYGAVDEVNEGCEWVLEGEGKAYIKWDGTPVLITDNCEAYQRYQAIQPISLMDAILCERTPTRYIYWIKARDHWIKEAFNNARFVCPGTFEAIGPKINGNRQKAERHVLVKHVTPKHLVDAPRNFNDLKEFLRYFKCKVPELYELWFYYEGIVFHHPDGRMAKIKRRDFGFDARERTVRDSP